jgi:HSP20 family protein
MKALVPFNGMNALRWEMDRLFDRFWDEDVLEIPAQAEWRPMMDLAETPESLVIKMEVPGIDPKEVHVSLQDQILTIRGDRKEEKVQSDERHLRKERRYGQFTRMVRLPVPVESKKVAATFKNGLLTIVVPKTKVAVAADIPIQVS